MSFCSTNWPLNFMATDPKTFMKELTSLAYLKAKQASLCPGKVVINLVSSVAYFVND